MEDNLKKILSQDINNGILKLTLDDNKNKKSRRRNLIKGGRRISEIKLVQAKVNNSGGNQQMLFESSGGGRRGYYGRLGVF